MHPSSSTLSDGCQGRLITDNLHSRLMLSSSNLLNMYCTSRAAAHSAGFERSSTTSSTPRASSSSTQHTAQQQQPAAVARQRRFSTDSAASNTTATASACAATANTAAMSGRRISIVDREAPRRVSDDKPPRPTKAFDPDALNSVQRHAASKAGLADAIQKMRK
jgi:hypothetical protein